MKGTVLGFDVQTGEGVILNDQDVRYAFSKMNWRDTLAPMKGQRVDFEPWGTMANNVFLDIQAGQFASVPAADMSFTDAVRSCFRRATDFQGRSRRKEYWYFRIVEICWTILVSVISDDLKHSGSVIAGLLNLLLILPCLYMFVVDLSVSVRRLHDTGRSGWWMLLYFTVIGMIPVWIMMCFDTDYRINKWGYPAKQP
ncbi:DUF805 domain-containing protein [Gluconobacter cerinus]|uniref:DUF805 domain-containing protein n=1 Tax=Gluconobacter cerinus TaxID=38307 RepID=UPI001B8B02E4|nr:DUF805 domain-containing protein [Gluconobacter cerinus]MBS1033778.1 DUF805 domain-containing protein [Gluconobacter cerinus]